MIIQKQKIVAFKELVDLVLDKIKQLNDICKFQYLNTLRLFDPNFSTNQNYNPDFQPLHRAKSEPMRLRQ